MLSDLSLVQPWGNRPGRPQHACCAPRNIVLTKLETSLWVIAFRLKASVCGGIDRRVQHSKPSLEWAVAHSRHHQQITRARSRNVENSRGLFALEMHLLLRMLLQFGRSAAGQLHDREPA